jgi:hypothetical protein
MSKFIYLFRTLSSFAKQNLTNSNSFAIQTKAIVIIKYSLFILLLCTVLPPAPAQEISFKDTVAAYNTHRIKINKTGMEVLGFWGIENIAEGAIGYFTAKQDEWKYFNEMNVLWGAVNTGIAAMGLGGVRKEMAKSLNAQHAYDRYLANKKLYLINAGLDVLYIGAGVGLTALGQSAKNNESIYTGFGRSFVVQGVFLLLFDNVMFAAHESYNSKWYRLMDEIRITNNGVGFSHNF